MALPWHYDFRLVTASVLIGRHAVPVDSLGISISIALITLILLGIVILQASRIRQLASRERVISEGRVQTQTIFDSLKEGVVVLDRNRNIIQVNQSAKDMLGLPAPPTPYDEIAGDFSLFLPNGEPLQPDVWPSALALRGEFLQNFELLIQQNNGGGWILTEISTAPIRDRHGNLTQIIVCYRDVTLSHEIDKARLRLAAIVESSEDAIVGKDLNGIVTSWNAAAEKIFGYTAQEMIGHSIRVLLPVDRLKEEDSILEQIRHGEIVDHIETVRRRKDGQFINVSLTISPIRDVAGNIVGASKIARNITAKKQLEGRIYQSQKMEAIGQLTGGIAHDFNNLLGVVIGNLDLVERRVEEDEFCRKRVQTALRAAMRGADLTRSLLTFSSREQLTPRPVLLDGPIRGTVELASRGIGPEITVSMQLDSSMPPVMADVGGLESALLNILVNARDAMPHGGQISISTRQATMAQDHERVQVDRIRPGRYAVITITDNGQGMSREVLERAFEPFFTTKERDKGTGLGLAMVYGFFKQSGGVVRIYSEPGYGTTVNCYLPLALNGSKPEPEMPATVAREKTSRHGTVLLVDDEVDLLDVATHYLEEAGYAVLRSTSGKDALEMVKRFADIDLMLTDVIMPGGMNGPELARQTRAARPDLRIIYTSGFPAGALAERKLSPANAPFLHKPYKRDELLAIVDKVMTSDLPAEPETHAADKPITEPR